jgi:hypothetical protein
MEALKEKLGDPYEFISRFVALDGKDAIVGVSLLRARKSHRLKKRNPQPS